MKERRHKLKRRNAFDEVETFLRDKILMTHNGLLIEDTSKKDVSHFIVTIQHMTVRNHNTELWINDTKRLELNWACEKITAEFIFRIVMSIHQGDL